MLNLAVRVAASVGLRGFGQIAEAELCLGGTAFAPLRHQRISGMLEALLQRHVAGRARGRGIVPLGSPSPRRRAKVTLQIQAKHETVNNFRTSPRFKAFASLFDVRLPQICNNQLKIAYVYGGDEPWAFNPTLEK